jgi:hypothetical protein|tara:strand:- start:6747 stop:7280 length:534 start_codon:yes stop_codon:yes gene_type:complete
LNLYSEKNNVTLYENGGFMNTSTLMAISFAGIGATLLMDLWSLLLRSLGIRTLDYAMLGRWCGHWAKGVWFHPSIQKASAVRGERLSGWVLHYLASIALALAFAGLVGPQWFRNPTLLPALCWGAATVLLPWMVLQPALGAGLAAARTPRPWHSRAISLATHIVFGLGLFLVAKAIA